MEVLKKTASVLTFEEYLVLEQDSDTRHEFSDGRLIPVEATTKAHNKIKRNLIRQIETPNPDDTDPLVVKSPTIKAKSFGY